MRDPRFKARQRTRWTEEQKLGVPTASFTKARLKSFALTGQSRGRSRAGGQAKNEGKKKKRCVEEGNSSLFTPPGGLEPPTSW